VLPGRRRAPVAVLGARRGNRVALVGFEASWEILNPEARGGMACRCAGGVVVPASWDGPSPHSSGAEGYGRAAGVA